MQYRRWTPSILALFIAAALITTGCSKCGKKKKVEAQDADMSASVDMAEEDTFDPAGTQLTFRNHFDTLVKGCTFDEFNKPTCEGDDIKETQKTYFKMVEEHGVVILPVLATGLGAQTDPPRRLAAYTLQEKGSQMIAAVAETPDKLDTAIVQTLMAPLLDRHAVDLVPRASIGTAIEAATLKEMDDEALGLLRTYDPEENKGEMWVHAEGVKHLMIYGRMRNFDYVKEVATKKHIPLQLAAFEAAWNMPSWTDEESAAICEWASEYYQADDDIKWKAMPARLLVRCNDRTKWDGALLEEAKRRIEKGIYARPFADAIRDLCKERPDEERYADSGTCADTRALLVEVTAAKNLPVEERAYAVTTISSIWTDDKAEAFVREQLATQDGVIKKHAAAALKKIELRQKVKENVAKQKASGEPKKGHEPR